MNEFQKRLRYHLYAGAVVLVFLLSLVFAGATLFVLSAGNKVDSTSVGPIYLGDHADDELSDILAQEIPVWRNEAHFWVRFQDQELDIDLSLFVFDVDSTLDHLQRDRNNNAYFTLSDPDPTELHADLDAVFSPTIIDELQWDAFLDDLTGDLNDLRQTADYDLEDYLNDSLATSIIQSTTLEDLTESDVDHIVSLASEITIEPISRFSILELFGETDLTNEQLSIIASGIETLTLPTSFTGFDFHANPQMPVWGRLGANVRILKVTGYDFSFYNDLKYGFTIEIEKSSATTLTFRLLGYPFVTAYEGDMVLGTTIPFEMIFLADDSINVATPGVIVIDTVEDTTYRLLVQTGVDGSVYHGIRTVTPPGGTPFEVQVFSEQYLPLNETYRENIVPKGGE
jgi:cbb3-type cytochrome oxidase subunit 3